MTIFSSGISMYAMAKLIQTLHVLDAPFEQMGLPASSIFDAAVLVSAAVVLVYIYLGRPERARSTTRSCSSS